MSEERSENKGQNIDYEVRFAVVMYGGVSLAIYINGVAQELLKMVRATCCGKGRDELNSTEKIYFDLGCIFSDKLLLEDLESKTVKQLKKHFEKIRNENKCSPTKFVVDIISGTSAGGINGVFLAKALAENLEIESLKELWLNEGDIAKLINDKKSVKDIDLDLEKDTKSLLNSNRMYLKLLEALDGMDKAKKNSGNNIDSTNDSLVDEIDLFITVTDFKGVSVPLRLLDKVIYERRYKHVFHFQHKQGKADFENAHNPMLALAARSTSAFPFAFEPMRVAVAENIIRETFDDAEVKIENLREDEKNFFKSIKDTDGKPIAWKQRDLVDGGYLDNKPFTYAINALSKRRADVQVERKLIYVEPSPENLGAEKSEFPNKIPAAPDALQNAKAAVSDLPRYETIREDLQKILDRNRLIERINRLVSGAEKDIFTTFAEFKEKTFESNPRLRLPFGGDSASSGMKLSPGEKWESGDLADIVREKGHAAVPYYRLRISGLTDELARFASAKFGIEENSEQFLAVRSIVNMWRKENFPDYRPKKSEESENENTNGEKDVISEGVETVESETKKNLKASEVGTTAGDENKNDKTPQNNEYNNNNDEVKTVLAFLRRFDLDYRVRRFRFVQQKANQLFQLDPDFVRIFKMRRDKFREIGEKFKEVDLSEENNLTIAQQTFDENIESSPKPIELILNKFVEPRLKPPKELDKKQLLTPTEIIYETFIENGDKKILKENDIKIFQLRLLLNFFQEKLKGIFSEFLIEKEKVYPEVSEKVTMLPSGLQALLELGTELRDPANASRNWSKYIHDNYRFIYEHIVYISKDLEEEFGKVRVKASKSIEKVLKNDWKGLPEQFKKDKVIQKLEAKFGDKKIEKEDVIIDKEIFNAVREYLFHFYVKFDYFDQIQFPAFFETQVGEGVQVDVLRISPRDATALFDETDPNEPRRKLAGTTLFNFGAFIDRVWRKNDIMWGRLDGAERLITAILPDKKYENLREYLIGEINQIILYEELGDYDKEELRNLLAESLVNLGSGIEVNKVVKKITAGVADEVVKKRLVSILRTLLTDEFENTNEKEELPAGKKLVEYVGKHYEVERRPDRDEVLRTISRATQTTGKVLEGVADKREKSGNQLRWITRLGTIFWGLVEVAAPNTVWNKLFYHWLKLIYAFEVFLIVVATILSNEPVQQLGIFSLAFTIIMHITVLTFSDYMRGGNIWSVVKFIFIGLFAILSLTGAIVLFAVFFNPKLWEIIVSVQGIVDKYSVFQKLFPVAVLILLFATSYIWNQFKKVNVRFLGIVTLGFVILNVILFGVFQNLTGNSGAIISLEFIHNFSELKQILGDDPETMRNGLRTSLILDSLVYIPLYAGFMIMFSSLLTYRRNKFRLRDTSLFGSLKMSIGTKKDEKFYSKVKRWFVSKFENDSLLTLLKGFTIVLVLSAAIADLFENYYSYKILDPEFTGNFQIGTLNSTIVEWIHLSAQIKFGLIAGVVLIFSTIFLRKPHWWKVLFLFLFVIALLGFVGIFPISLFGFGEHELIPKFMRLLILMLAIVGIIFIAVPKKFKLESRG